MSPVLIGNLLLMRGARKFCPRGFILIFFLVDEGIEDPNTPINGPSSACSETLFQWRFVGGPMMAQR